MAPKFLKPDLVTTLGQLYQADCLDVLPRLESEMVDAIFADPPFNLSKDYGTRSSDNRAEQLRPLGKRRENRAQKDGRQRLPR